MYVLRIIVGLRNTKSHCHMVEVYRASKYRLTDVHTAEEKMRQARCTARRLAAQAGPEKTVTGPRTKLRRLAAAAS